MTTLSWVAITLSTWTIRPSSSSIRSPAAGSHARRSSRVTLVSTSRASRPSSACASRDTARLGAAVTA